MAGWMHAGHHVPKASHKLAVVLQIHGGLAEVLVGPGVPRLKVADDVGRLVIQLIKLLQITAGGESSSYGLSNQCCGSGTGSRFKSPGWIRIRILQVKLSNKNPLFQQTS